jgi:hypothetical protein
LGPHLGGNLSLEQIKQLFMKIDADAGGTVDWWVSDTMARVEQLLRHQDWVDNAL